MPLQTKETKLHPIFLFDAPSDFPSEQDSLIDHKLGKNYLNLVKGGVVYTLTVHRQLDVRAIAPVEDIFLGTENILGTNVTESFQGLIGNIATWKSLASGTYNEPGVHNHRVALLTKLNESPLIKHGPTDKVHEGWIPFYEDRFDRPFVAPAKQVETAHQVRGGWTSFFEDIFNRPFAVPAKQAETTHVELREATEETQEQQDISNELFTSAELNGVLADLQEVIDEAREEGFPVPSDIAIANSEQLIKNLYEISPGRYGVYPTQDGEIAIDVFNGKGSSVILLCDSAGGTLCLVNIDGNRRRAHYSQINALPDGFVREALAELKL